VEYMTEDYLVLAEMSYDLRDASEELSKIIDLISPDGIFDQSEFDVKFAHLFWHLNKAWNIRNLTNKDLESADGKQLNSWAQFPTDLKPL
jgi:hypothetical protein